MHRWRPTHTHARERERERNRVQSYSAKFFYIRCKALFFLLLYSFFFSFLLLLFCADGGTNSLTPMPCLQVASCFSVFCGVGVREREKKKEGEK
ncbi:hypothetical protein TCDM_05887 [Trypanosoma cruzi Dm28c]|uniref:Transmembrane protein n=1 Tax=Trypanosoma cruzi Dm28c TaxID=1416333 RepID=V5DDX9_TRYCR|nr:hypothetical protein TCDM_05887 [Trypanosoma cruzi Dm28c]